jgi:hypothetical protein
LNNTSFLYSTHCTIVEYHRPDRYLHSNPLFTSNGQELVGRGQLVTIGEDWRLVRFNERNFTKLPTKARPPIPIHERLQIIIERINTYVAILYLPRSFKNSGVGNQNKHQKKTHSPALSINNTSTTYSTTRTIPEYDRPDQYLHDNPFITSNGQELVCWGSFGGDWRLVRLN